MPWRNVTKMSMRKDFVCAALKEAVSFRALCREFGISPKTGYKWMKRYRTGGEAALADQSRRPHHSPTQTQPATEQLVVAVRKEHPVWGGRKIHARLGHLGEEGIPAPSTITDILRRHDLLDPDEGRKHRAYQRFARAEPNQLWQMDFKGHFPLRDGTCARDRCHPLTSLDDHSRFLILLRACPNEQGETVQSHLSSALTEYGMPEAMLMDNGSPWGHDADHPYTRFTVWLLRLGIRVIHGRAYHPQTQGKEERLHRTLKAEALRDNAEKDLPAWQKRFDAWRDVYNHQRPHEALEMDVPASRYRPSNRAFPTRLPPIEYESDDLVRKVDVAGRFSFRGRPVRVGKGFAGQPVAVRPTLTDGEFEVYFCHRRIARIDLREHPDATD